MANLFNAAEVIDMGIEKEKKRRDFYGLVAAKFKEQEMIELFSKLRDWEEEHIKKFTQIRDSVEESEATESYEGELGAYMKAVIDDMLYKQVSGAAFSKHVKDPLTAIRYGITFEKDAILFFNEILRYMIPHNRESVQKLIDEEKGHIIYLSELKRKYE
ncbi:MAG: ferritin family protein [Candidatus Omnitrophota bacterium]|nr:ferritin family protein [Candidatus Omnitrophota bacterium]